MDHGKRSYSGSKRITWNSDLPSYLWIRTFSYSRDAAHHADTDDPSKRGGKVIMKAAILITVMSAVTILLRFLPFLIFRNNTPPYITYLGKVLPPAIIGMLVIYCLKDVSFSANSHGLPELIASVFVIGLQVWKRNTLVSILTGTIIYMLLIQSIF